MINLKAMGYILIPKTKYMKDNGWGDWSMVKVSIQMNKVIINHIHGNLINRY